MFNNKLIVCQSFANNGLIKKQIHFIVSVLIIHWIEQDQSFWMISKNIIFLFVISYTRLSNESCRTFEKKNKYFQTSICHRSNQVLIASTNVDNIEECSRIANRKKALAFNFSPPEALKLLPKFKQNCELLGCPETGEAKTLTQNLAYDYYSAYGNPNGKNFPLIFIYFKINLKLCYFWFFRQ